MLVIITDDNLLELHGKKLAAQLQADILSIPAGEIYKTRETKLQLENELLARQYGRDTCLIALGGGVICDLVGFLAATYCRGIPVIYIPTTLLAMVDACVGGKTAVNTPFGKNMIGVFQQPLAVFIDPNLLTTLPDHEYKNGIVEMIKHGLIADPVLFDLLKNNVQKLITREPDFLNTLITENQKIKKNIVAKDQKDLGHRQILNFGHTIGHAIEKVENYQISHGQAVALGILVESYLSVYCGYLSETVFTEIKNILTSYDLPLKTTAFKQRKLLEEALLLDKKAIQRTPRFVLLNAIGKPRLESIDPKQLCVALDWAEQYLC